MNFQKLIELSRKLDIPLVATNDAHYLKKGDAYNHEVLLCIQTGKRMSDTDRMKFDTEELYIKSPEEMIDYFKNFPEAIENTVKIANECNVEFEFGNTILPNYDVPEEFETHLPLRLHPYSYPSQLPVVLYPTSLKYDVILFIVSSVLSVLLIFFIPPLRSISLIILSLTLNAFE